MNGLAREQLIESLASWLRTIGITVRLEPVSVAAFRPGLTIDGGALIIDPDQLNWPGEISP